MAEDKKQKFTSIFDAVSKIERKKVVEKLLKQDSSQTASLITTGEKVSSLTDEEIVKKLDEYEKLHNLLADSLEKAFVKNNLSPRRLREYFSTSQNFSAEQWRLIENERQNIDEMLDRLSPTARARGEKTTSKTEKSEEQRPKKMQVKSRWLPMH
jgi:hypothetical protein